MTTSYSLYHYVVGTQNTPLGLVHKIPSMLSLTHSLRSGPSDGVHDGVHVEVTLAGGGGANAHCLVGHLHMHLEELG